MAELNIYELGLHEEAIVLAGPSEYRVLRVAGGWIYYNPRLDSSQMNSTFVPFDNEYLKHALSTKKRGE